jgi:hypothetical protein
VGGAVREIFALKNLTARGAVASDAVVLVDR